MNGCPAVLLIDIAIVMTCGFWGLPWISLPDFRVSQADMRTGIEMIL
jgi:hypothetical protein